MNAIISIILTEFSQLQKLIFLINMEKNHFMATEKEKLNFFPYTLYSLMDRRDTVNNVSFC